MAKKHAWLVLVAVVLAFGIPTVSWAGGAGGGESYGETTLTVEGMTWAGGWPPQVKALLARVPGLQVTSTDVGSQTAGIKFPAGTKLSAIINAFAKSNKYNGKLTQPVDIIAKDKGIEAKAHTDAATYTKGGSGTVSVEVGAVGEGFSSVKVSVKPTKGAGIEKDSVEHSEAVAAGSSATLEIPFTIDKKAKSPDAGIQVTIEATTEGGKTVKTKTVVPILITG